MVVEALETLTSSWGFKTQMANNRVTALASLEVNIPDLILSDYQLQEGETGLDVIAEINQETNKMIPALLLTGNTNKENIKILQTQPYLFNVFKGSELLKNSYIYRVFSKSRGQGKVKYSSLSSCPSSF